MDTFAAPISPQPCLVAYLTGMRSLAVTFTEASLSDFALAGTVLTRDLHAASGKLVAARGEIIDLAKLKGIASRAGKQDKQRPLHETPLADAVLEAFDAAPLNHFVLDPDARAKV